MDNWNIYLFSVIQKIASIVHPSNISYAILEKLNRELSKIT